MKNIVFATCILFSAFFLIGCPTPAAPKALSGDQLQKVQDSFEFEDTNSEEGLVEGDINLTIDFTIPQVTDFEIYYGDDPEGDNTLIGTQPAKDFKEGVIATLETTDFTGNEKLFLFLKNTAYTQGNNSVYSGVNLVVLDDFEEIEEEEDFDEEAFKAGGRVLDNIYFDFDKDNLKEESKIILDDFIASTIDLDEVQVVITGHADERGSNEYNIALGERRSLAVQNYLILQGVPSENIRAISYGEERPLCTESEESCWQENRRSETTVSP